MSRKGRKGGRKEGSGWIDGDRIMGDDVITYVLINGGILGYITH